MVFQESVAVAQPAAGDALSLAVNLSLACFPGIDHRTAVYGAVQLGGHDALAGQLCTDNIQLVPQSRGLVDESLCDELVACLPGTRWRLHANVRVLPERRVYDLATFDRDKAHFERAAQLSRRLRARCYSAHAGRRSDGSLASVIDAAHRLAEWFDAPVAVEGHYPERNAHPWLISTWEEYAGLRDSGVPYALDLSHLNIVARNSGRVETALTAELLAAENCVEIHISHNDGTGDWHQRLPAEGTWWWPLLVHANRNATVFSEGNLLRERRSGSAPVAAQGKEH